MATNATEFSLNKVSFNQVFTRTELRLVQPVWDFGKISAGVAAARAGVDVSREREAGARADVELNVRKAYYGIKLARELIATLEEGSGYIDEAQKRIESDLAKGTGNTTVTDRLRLRVVRAEVDARIQEAKRGEAIARDGLRALLGPDTPADLDVDDEEFAPRRRQGPRRSRYYEDQARFSRPEVRLLDHAVRAKHALADLERRKEYPDLVLIANGALAYAGGVDDPQNAFMNHYFHSSSIGVAAALRMQLDLGPKIARASRTRAEADRDRVPPHARRWAASCSRCARPTTSSPRRATAPRRCTRASGRARSWISAVSQNFAVGLAEARDFSDALQRLLPDEGALPTGGVRPQRRRLDAGARDRRVRDVSRRVARAEIPLEPVCGAALDRERFRPPGFRRDEDIDRRCGSSFSARSCGQGRESEREKL